MSHELLSKVTSPAFLDMIERLETMTENMFVLRMSQRDGLPASPSLIDAIQSECAELGHELLHLAGVETSLPILELPETR